MEGRMPGSKFINTLKLVGVIICMLVTLGASLAGFFVSADAKGFASSEAASWAQAFGSIVAVWAAVGIAFFQNKSAQRLAKNVEAIKLERRYSAVLAIAIHANTLVQEVANNLSTPTEWYGYFQLSYTSSVLDDAEKSLALIPLHETGSFEMVNGIRIMTSSLRKMRSLADSLSQDQGRSHVDVEEILKYKKRLSDDCEAAFGLIRKSIDSKKNELG
jgi:uncharacterized membrane protein